MARTTRAVLTVEERQVVDRFAAGESVHAVAQAARLPVLTVERLLRRALGYPSNGTRRAGRTREVSHG